MSVSVLVATLITSGCALSGEAVDVNACLSARYVANNDELIIAASEGNAANLGDVLKMARLPCVAQLQIDGACLVIVPHTKGQSAEVIAQQLRSDIFARSVGNAPSDVQKIVGSVAVNFEIPEIGLRNGFQLERDGSDREVSVPALFDNQLELAALHASTAWFDARDSKVVTAIIDNGVSMRHEDLTGQFSSGVTIGCDAEPCDGSVQSSGRVRGHGTQIAGIIGARKTGDEDSAGVAWNTKFISINYGRGIDEFRLSCALQHAIANNVDVVSGSWTELPEQVRKTNASWRTFEKYVRRAQDRGILLVVAAGNGNVDVDRRPLNPLRLKAPNMLGVMSFDVTANQVTNDNYGLHTLHIAGPHFGSVTTSAMCTTRYVSTVTTGTSWATAYVAGAAALLKSHYPRSDYDFLKWRIMANARPDQRLRQLNESGGTLDLVSTIFPVVSPAGDLSRTHAMPIVWKNGLRADMCASVSIEARWVEGKVTGEWFRIIPDTPNDGIESLPSEAFENINQDHVQLRVQCSGEILGAESQPLPLH